MKVYACILGLLLLNSAISQVDRGPINVAPNGVIDGVVLKEEVPVRSKVEYEHVREADYVWSKRVFSRIDAREKINHPIFFPYDFVKDDDWTPPANASEIDNPNWIKHQERYSLWTIIVKHIMLGNLNVYEVSSSEFPAIEDGFQFKYPVIKQTSEDYFTNALYRKSINKKLSYGGSGGEWEIVGDDENATKTKLMKYDAGESFEAWFDRITTKGVAPDFDPEYFAALLRLPETGAKITKSVLKAQYDAVAANITLKNPDVSRFITSASITAYNIKEDWFFDKERSMLDRRIIAIAPVGRMKPLEIQDEAGVNDDGIDRFKNFVGVDRNGFFQHIGQSGFEKYEGQYVEKELFWLYFPELRDVMINYYVYNEQNDAQWMSFDDLFWKRKFNSTIYRVSDKFDREIEDYQHAVDALYKAEKIKDEIRTWEIDVWNY